MIRFEFRDHRERSRVISALRESADASERRARSRRHAGPDGEIMRRELRQYAQEARELAERIEAA